MQVPVQMNPEMHPEINEASSTGPASPSSPGSDSIATKSTTPTLEKPVKVLPCPRCESMNTKFCYYNNYSVTQPRHFCRQCQRYWTAGGTLRNVPVGGGSRKKNRHHREPYSQQQQRSQAGPSGMQNVGLGLQPMAFNFAGYGHQYAPYGLEQLTQLGSQVNHHPGVYASLKPDVAAESSPSSSHHHAMFANSTGSLGSQYYLHDAAPPPPFPTDTTTAAKPEFWPMAAPNPSKLNGRYEAPMLLNLGVHNNINPTNPKTGKKGSSALQACSSIEEEGSTPSNGFSKSRYEGGDGVSSMWHSLHDMDNLHLSVKW